MGDSPAKQFLPLESNPETMNAYLKMLGIPEPKVAFFDVFGLDPELMAMVQQPVRAFLLLFPITKRLMEEDAEAIKAQREEVEKFTSENSIFFGLQLISNACGTMGILHAVINNLDYVGDVTKGSPIDLFCAKAAVDSSPSKLAEAILHSTDLEKAHQEASLMHTENVESIDTATDLHFTCFVHIKDRCVELDGRHPNPRLHGSCSDNASFIAATSTAIAEKIKCDPESIRYNIIALSDISPKQQNVE